MDLIPVEIGPLNPQVQDLAVGVVLFAACFLCLLPLLRRMNRVLEARERATDGVTAQAERLRALAEEKRAEIEAELAAARHDASRTRRRAEAEGAALIAESRAEGLREREELFARAAARIDADLTTARAELQDHLPRLAAELASRVLGEPVGPETPTRAADAW
ncbi:hypothetical protein [Streptomyces aquilus]|uniref:F0F1 ATP synthase subunit B family protein n=1 Tax=Streptomyces aquilus TaxID=2548456 RepID=UPI0036B9F525